MISREKFNEYLKAREYGLIQNYKVDNAIILAAGCSRRCLPYSKIIPKGLFVVKGQVLIERQIEQILETGIKDIIIVVGYLKDEYKYLENRYNVKLVNNPEYESTNNMSSIYYAREYLANSYICGSDNWYSNNPFSLYNYNSYFSCLYTDDYVDEYCIEEINGIISKIKKGGKKTWYTLGEIYINNYISDFMVNDLKSNYETSKHMIIDEYCIKNINHLFFDAKRRNSGLIYEFDTIEEFCEFDSGFGKYLENFNITRGGL